MAYSDQAEKKEKPDKDRHAPFYYSTVYGVDKDHATPYMTRLAIYRLRLHIFHRGDADPDCHDHPWGFWTFPFVSYVEEVLDHENGRLRIQVVRSWRWNYRPATHSHRVLYSLYLKGSGGKSCFGFNSGYRHEKSKKIITLVWAEQPYRKWGFWKKRNGNLCWQYWKDYIFNGGKHTACTPEQVAGEVADTAGNIWTVRGHKLRCGIVMVTPEQAKRAQAFGWVKVRPDAGGALVEIFRK